MGKSNYRQSTIDFVMGSEVAGSQLTFIKRMVEVFLLLFVALLVLVTTPFGVDILTSFPGDGFPL